MVFRTMCFVGHVPVHRVWQHMPTNTTIVANLVFTNLSLSALLSPLSLFFHLSFSSPTFCPASGWVLRHCFLFSLQKLTKYSSSFNVFIHKRKLIYFRTRGCVDHVPVQRMWYHMPTHTIFFSTNLVFVNLSPSLSLFSAATLSLRTK